MTEASPAAIATGKTRWNRRKTAEFVLYLNRLVLAIMLVGIVVAIAVFPGGVARWRWTAVAGVILSVAYLASWHLQSKLRFILGALANAALLATLWRGLVSDPASAAVKTLAVVSLLVCTVVPLAVLIVLALRTSSRGHP